MCIRDSPFTVLERVDNRDFFISLFCRTYFGMVHDNFRMENLLVYFLTEIIRHGTDKRWPIRMLLIHSMEVKPFFTAADIVQVLRTIIVCILTVTPVHTTAFW